MSEGKARIGILGAGLMGHGIAQIFAAHGHETRVYDPSEAARDALKGRIAANLRDLGEDESCVERVTACATIADAVSTADFVVEAALENLEIKRELFAEVERCAPAHAILASNTSVIPITAIMRDVTDGARALGTHWWNPPFLVPLVEVISAERTSQAAVDWTLALHKSIGKTPVHVKKDVPGFVGNRLQHALWREAIALVEQGVCDAATVDTVVKASFGRRLAALGPIENADLIGLDLTLAIHETVLPAIDSRPAPSPLLKELIAQGRLGMKSGEGFLPWSEEAQRAVRQRVFQHLKAARDADA